MTAGEIRNLRARIVEAAIGEIGVHEERRNNRGPRVEEYQRAAGAKPGSPWCAAFVRWVLDAAGAPLAPRMVAGVARSWRGWPEGMRLSPDRWPFVEPGDVLILARSSSADPVGDAAKIRRGRVLVGHCGIVIEVDHVRRTVETVEGNVWRGREGVRPRGGVATRVHYVNEPGTVGYLSHGWGVETTP